MSLLKSITTLLGRGRAEPEPKPETEQTTSPFAALDMQISALEMAVSHLAVALKQRDELIARLTPYRSGGTPHG